MFRVDLVIRLADHRRETILIYIILAAKIVRFIGD